MAAELEKLIVTLQADLRQYERQLAKAQGITTTRLRAIEREASASATRIEAAWSALGSSFRRGFVGALGAVSVGAIANQLEQVIQKFAEIQDAADRAGVSAEFLQSLNLAGLSAGSKEMAESIQKFNLEIGEAATKGGALADILKANGVAIEDANGNIRDTQELFFEVVDLIARAGSLQEAMVIAQLAFGKASKDSIAFLRQGADAIRGQQQALKESGAIVDNELVAKADRFVDKWNEAFERFQARAFVGVGEVVGFFQQIDDIAKSIARSFGFIPVDMFTGLALDPQADAAAALATALDQTVRLSEEAKDIQAEIDAARQDELAKVAALQGLLAGVTAQLETQRSLVRSTVAQMEPWFERGRTQGPRPETIIPDPEAERRRQQAIADAEREKAAIDALIASLQFEATQLGLTSLQQDINTALRQAGANATEEQRQAIIDLVTARHEEAAALEQVANKQKELADAAKQASDDAKQVALDMQDAFKNAFGDLAVAAGDGKLKVQELVDVLDSLRDRLLRIAAEAIFEMILRSLTQSQQGGQLSFLFPQRAAGGPVSAGQPYVVGERQPELFIPGQSGTIIPSVPSSGGGNVTINNFGAEIEQQRTGPNGRDLVLTVKAVMKSEFPDLLNTNAPLIGARPASRRVS